jgi:hypothetical protein
MARRRRPTVEIELSSDERKMLERWARRRRGVGVALHRAPYPVVDLKPLGSQYHPQLTPTRLMCSDTPERLSHVV